MEKNNLKTDRTVLDQFKLHARRGTAIATAFTLALFMAGCGENSQGDADSGNEQVVEHADIAGLGAHKDSKLVQGRDNCIKALVESGSTPEAAAKACDAALAQATVEHGNGGVAHNYNNSSGGANNNMLFWYLLSRNNQPVVYYTPSPGAALSYYGGAGGARSSVPEHLTSVQSEFLRAPMAQRPTIGARLAATPGARTVTSFRSSGGSSFGKSSGSSFHGGATSHGGMSVGHGVSTGG